MVQRTITGHASPLNRRLKRPLNPLSYIYWENPRGHDLIELYGMTRERVDLDIRIASLSRLSTYYTQARYPNAGMERPSKEITREQAEEALETARRIINEVSKAIKDP